MARTHIRKLDAGINVDEARALTTKLNEHDVALDALEGSAGTGAIAKVHKVIVFSDIPSGSHGSSGAPVTFQMPALPANARIMGIDLTGFVPFTGGTTSAMVLKIGAHGGDLSALLASSNMFAAAVSGSPSTFVEGIQPNKFYASATTLDLTFTPTGDAWDNLTAGGLTIDVLYAVVA